MRSIKFLSHTADVKIRLQASSEEELLKAGMEAIHGLLLPDACANFNTAEVTEEVHIQAPDKTALLVDFLSDVLSASHYEKAVFCDFEVKKWRENDLEAILKGEKVDRFVEDIKAITYHEAEVIRDENGNWESILIFDI